MRRLAAIRTLARQMPLESADERLAIIADVASGKGDVEGHFKSNVQSNLHERLEAGIASRSPMPGDAKPKKEEAKPERKEKSGRNRKERSGPMRSSDLPGGDN